MLQEKSPRNLAKRRETKLYKLHTKSLHWGCGILTTHHAPQLAFRKAGCALIYQSWLYRLNSLSDHVDRLCTSKLVQDKCRCHLLVRHILDAWWMALMTLVTNLRRTHPQKLATQGRVPNYINTTPIREITPKSSH